MKYIFQLSGEHQELPNAELLSVLETEICGYRIIEEFPRARIIVIDINTKNSSFVKRLALTKIAAEYIDSSDNLGKLSDSIYRKIKNSKSFRIRCKSNTVESELGALLFKKKLKVNLENPEKEVICFQIDNRIIAGIKIPLKKDFEERKPQYRPFFHPTSMHPKIARVLVNLARVKKNDLLLDPFCGTGGILIEAGLIGLKLMGFDIDQRMVKGCKRNLKFYKLNGDIKEENALEFNKKIRVDAIVTDLPYGRSSYASQKNLKELYRKFLKTAYNILHPNKFLVIILPKEFSINFYGFSIVENYDIRVHKSLTRRIWVLKRK